MALTKGKGGGGSQGSGKTQPSTSGKQPVFLSAKIPPKTHKT